MSWNIVPECISTVILCIIWIYSIKGNPIPSLKNRVFQACFLITFCAMLSNIISTVLIYKLTPALLIPTWLINTFYFIMTPLMGMVYAFYTICNIYEDQKRAIKNMAIVSIPGVLYVIMVLINPVTHSIFRITLEKGYEKGPAIVSTYIIFYLYCIYSVIIVIAKRHSVPAPIRRILFTFPVVAALVIIIQLIYPTIILSGSAATSALLLIYLYLQNKQISIDHLTGVPNRQEFLKMLELKTKKQASSRFSILVVSLVEFKRINDAHGQHNGDAFLSALSSYLRKISTEKNGKVFRYSGDEFAILEDNISPDSLKAITETIISRMQHPWDTAECTCYLTAAIGIVSYPDTVSSMSEVINGIEHSVALAKKADSQQHICYCNSKILAAVRRQNNISVFLKEYTAQNKFEVYYQPILSVEDKSFRSAEALLRMNNTPIGNIGPAEFIPLAEESGMIIEITYLVLDRVCKDIRRMLDNGFQLDGISVNFSTLQFSQKDLIFRLMQIMESNQIPYNKLKIEITESTLAENYEVITSFLNQMHDLGIRIGLDDFGTGYSNLTSFTHLPIDTVKLDKSLVHSAMSNERTAILVENIAHAFLQLGTRVLAEGVETEEQSEFMIRCGCSLIQGFLYARPVPYPSFEKFMEQAETAIPNGIT